MWHTAWLNLCLLFTSPRSICLLITLSFLSGTFTQQRTVNLSRSLRPLQCITPAAQVTFSVDKLSSVSVCFPLSEPNDEATGSLNTKAQPVFCISWWDWVQYSEHLQGSVIILSWNNVILPILAFHWINDPYTLMVNPADGWNYGGYYQTTLTSKTEQMHQSSPIFRWHRHTVLLHADQNSTSAVYLKTGWQIGLSFKLYSFLLPLMFVTVVLLAALERITMLEVILPSAARSCHLPLPETVKASAQSELQEHHLLPLSCHRKRERGRKKNKKQVSFQIQLGGIKWKTLLLRLAWLATATVQ